MAAISNHASKFRSNVRALFKFVHLRGTHLSVNHDAQQFLDRARDWGFAPRPPRRGLARYLEELAGGHLRQADGVNRLAIFCLAHSFHGRSPARERIATLPSRSFASERACQASGTLPGRSQPFPLIRSSHSLYGASRAIGQDGVGGLHRAVGLRARGRRPPMVSADSSPRTARGEPRCQGRSRWNWAPRHGRRRARRRRP